MEREMLADRDVVFYEIISLILVVGFFSLAFFCSVFKMLASLVRILI